MKKIYVAGSINMDLVIKTDIFPQNGMTVMGSGFMTNPGGKGANQAVAIAKAEGNVKMIGAVGDAFGNELIETLNNYKVNTDLIKHHNNISSGIAVIVISENDNRIILDSGSNGLVTLEQIKESLVDAESGDYFLTQQEIPVDVVEQSIKYAKDLGLVTILNPAPAQKIDESVFEYLDFFIPNQTECEFYTGIKPSNIDEAVKAGQVLIDKGVKNVIITLGSLGALAINKDGHEFAKAYKVNAIDTTAAGDTFVGVTTCFLSKGYDIKEAIKHGNLAARITVQRPGAQQSIPYLEEILSDGEKGNN